VFVLQESETGHAIKDGASLASPITNCRKDEGRDCNFEANPAYLRKTKNGEVAKTKGNLQSEITHIRKEVDVMDYINFEVSSVSVLCLSFLHYLSPLNVL